MELVRGTGVVSHFQRVELQVLEVEPAACELTRSPEGYLRAILNCATVPQAAARSTSRVRYLEPH